MTHTIRGGLLLLGVMAVGTLYAGVKGFDFDISGSSVRTDAVTRVVTVQDAEFPLGGSSATVSADSVSFIAPRVGNPVSVQLGKLARISQQGRVLLASDAVYYPELDTLTAQSLKGEGIAGSTWTCQSGILFQDGASTGKSSMCWGAAEISCTGSGGNRVRYLSSSPNCP